LPDALPQDTILYKGNQLTPPAYSPTCCTASTDAKDVDSPREIPAYHAEPPRGSPPRAPQGHYRSSTAPCQNLLGNCANRKASLRLLCSYGQARRVLESWL